MSKAAKLVRIAWIPILVLLVILPSCNSNETNLFVPTTPGFPDFENRASQHQLWGYWEGYILESHDSLELVPIRTADIHLNARHLLEETPCNDCITLVNLEVDQAEGVMRADIQITHPYAGYDRYTGFDVRAVIISDGSLVFPGLDAVVPHQSMGDFTLINPDGYTRLWNTIEFPPGSGPFEILEYSKGYYAYPGDFTGTVNPFIKYSMEPRDHFPAGGSITRTLEFNLVPGPLKFGYAIDASWMLPMVEPVTDIWTDFHPSANAMEPAVTSVSMSDDVLTDEQGDTAWLRVRLRDRQSTWGYILGGPWELEAPELWDGICLAKQGYSSWGDYLNHFIADSFMLINEYGVPPGEYFSLLKVVDPKVDFWLGDVNHLYHLITIPVIEYQEPQINGAMVFVAPEVDPTFPPGALNVFLLYLDGMFEGQLTPFVGVGAIFQEPRLNPAGTHMLLTFGPTPFASHVDVYEIGGGSWSVSPSAVYDGHADFHPDGDHILVASGSQFDDTPHLYSMNYDGSERTLIATAPELIRNPRWSPDGTRIVMTQGLEFWDPPNNSLWIYNLDTETFTEIMSAPGIDENPSWSPVQVDGQDLIVYASSRDHHPEYETDIYVINPDTEEILCHLDTGVYESHPSFSPDGLSFVFSMVSDGSDDSELYVYFWQTEELVQLTDDDTYDGSPSWGWNW